MLGDVSKVLKAIGKANDIDLCVELLGSEVAEGFVDEPQLLGACKISVFTDDDPYFVGEANWIGGWLSC